MCKVCTEAVHSVALWTRVTLQVCWTCVQYVLKQSIPWHFEHGLHYRFGHVQSMYRSSPPRSILNTAYITGLDMCKVWTEAVHCAALWTCVQVQKNVIIPTPPNPTLSHVMCARVTLGGKNDAKLCLCVLVTPVCVRGWPPDPLQMPVVFFQQCSPTWTSFNFHVCPWKCICGITLWSSWSSSSWSSSSSSSFSSSLSSSSSLSPLPKPHLQTSLHIYTDPHHHHDDPCVPAFDESLQMRVPTLIVIYWGEGACFQLVAFVSDMFSDPWVIP